MTGSTNDSAISVTRYTSVAILLHWLIATAIVAQLVLGWRMGAMKGLAGFSAFQLHKSIGITILLLSLARLGWRLTHRPPPSPAGSPRWEQNAARAAHVGFYALMIGMPLTGWIIVSVSRIAIPTLLYTVVPWPHVPGLSTLPRATKAMLEGGFATAHTVLAFGMVGLLALHVAAALKHHLVDRDDVVAHMLPGVRPGRRGEPRLWLSLAAIVIVAAATFVIFAPRAVPISQAEAPAPIDPSAPDAAAQPVTPAPAAKPTPETEKPAEALAAPAEPVVWAVAPGGRLNFTAGWSGEPIEGVFKKWRADVLFSPDALDKSRIRVTIDMGSADTGNSQRDTSLPSADWFDLTRYPQAVFTAKQFRKTSADHYVANGTLTLRGVSAPLTLRFKLKIAGDVATVSGTSSIDRVRFGVGQGEWATTDQIAGQVAIGFNLTARRKPASPARP